MRAMVLESQRRELQPATLPDPVPGPGELLLEVQACGVCRTDLHLRDAEIPATKLPVVLGHQIVATTPEGRRVGVPWLGWTDGTCAYCTSGRENLCVSARFTGRDIDGGYAQLTVADERFCLPLPDELSDQEAAPLLCGGLIGYRALTFTGDAERLGLYGFGSAAHMICQLAVFQGRRVFAFTRPGDERTQAFARGPVPRGLEEATRRLRSRSTRRSSSLLPARSFRRRSACSRPTEWSSAPASI
jgi:propanol-preferring alcohol dehydrogenase